MTSHLRNVLAIYCICAESHRLLSGTSKPLAGSVAHDPTPSADTVGRPHRYISDCGAARGAFGYRNRKRWPWGSMSVLFRHSRANVSVTRDYVNQLALRHRLMMMEIRTPHPLLGINDDHTAKIGTLVSDDLCVVQWICVRTKKEFN